MINIQKYIVDGRVMKTSIAMDVVRGEISREDIKLLLQDSRIKDSFIDTHYRYKESRDNWNKEYIDKLTFAAVAECFNEDYLMHLCDVAKYVNSKKFNDKIITYSVVLAVAVAAIVVMYVVMKQPSV